MSNDQLHNTAGTNLSVSDVVLDVVGVASALPTSLTLTGTGFGAIANPKPSAWDDFSEYSGLADGDTIPKDGNPNWDKVGGTFGSGYKLNSSLALSGQEFCVESTSKKAYLEILKPRVDGAPVNYDRMYMSWYFRSNEKLGAANQLGNASDKILRVWDALSGDGMRVSWLATHGGYNTNSRFVYFDQSAFEIENSQWHRLECLVDDSGEKAKQKLWIDGKLAGEIETLDVTGTHENLNSSQQLVDSAMPWAGASMKGCKVYNVTDGSSGVIQNGSDVNGDTITVTGLSGGTNNSFNVGDTYRITGFVGHLPAADQQEFFVKLVGYDPSAPENINNTMRHYIADVNQYPSQARVELSNSPVYDDNIKQSRAAQKCAYRTDTEIQIPKIFYGTLDQGQPIYAHIIKHDGSVINYGSVE